MKTWISKNWVVISGFLGAILLSLQQFVAEPVVDWKVIGFGALMATLSWAANQWRGKGVTVTGIIGTLAGTFVTIYSTGTFSWQQFWLQAIVAILAAVAPPPKPQTYETNVKIVEAKETPPINQVKDDTKLP